MKGRFPSEAPPVDVHPDAIAVIGMAGRFPGAADADELWANVRAGRESISFFSSEELDPLSGPPELLAHPDYVAAKGIVEGTEDFDCGFFGVSPAVARLMDPQHRVLLEAAWEALEMAGYAAPETRRPTGVFAGCGVNTYFMHRLAAGTGELAALGELQATVGNDKDFLATQVSYRFDLDGPSLSVQTACSTSLVAVHLACQSLLSGECDLALAGGVSLKYPMRSGYLYQPDSIQSPDGHCRPFAADAQGTVTGCGVGVVLLKPLERALADRDTILAVLRGSAVNNDGAKKVGFTAPSVDGQSRVIAEALAAAEVPPDSISYVEAHGTGTQLGDPIEVAALNQVFTANGAAPAACYLGSLKSNIGHLDAAAGIAGLIKVIQSLRHRELPPSLHFRRPNPGIDFAAGPFEVNRVLRPWPSGPTPRRAGVSSFGLGGTNAHLVVEEAAEPPAPAPTAKAAALLVLSARSEESLDALGDALADDLDEHPELSLADASYTLQVGRQRFEHRRAVVASGPGEAAAALRAARRGRPVHQGASERPVAFLFPGQGEPIAGVATRLYRQEEVFRSVVDRCCRLLEPALGLDLRELLFPAGSPDAAAERLHATRLAQPALFVVEYALAELWRSWGVEPDALLGHSLGEYVAACQAGVFDLPACLDLVAARGRLMNEAAPGGMLAVSRPAQEVEPVLGDGLSIAAVNTPKRCVVSGPPEALDALEERLGQEKVPCRRMAAERAFHSSMMRGAADRFAEILGSIEMRAPRTPWVSNVTGDWITPAAAQDPAYWVEQMLSPVRFADGVLALLAADRVLLQVGPGRGLLDFARQVVRGRPESEGLSAVTSISATGAPAELFGALGDLWCEGARIDWQRFWDGEARRRVPLPTYRFDRVRCWIELSPAEGRAERQPAPPEQVPTAAAAVPAAAGPTAASRREAILHRLIDLVGELLGARPEQIDTGLPFIDVGVDSLLLIQASQMIDRRFGVKLSLAQLLAEQSTLDAVADYLDSRLPAAGWAGDAGEPGGVAPVAPAPSSSAAGGPGGEVHPFAAPAQTAPPGGGLSPAQRRHLRDLIATYTAKTAASKAHTERYRPVLAENRATVGFRLAWKELIYPITSERSAGSKIWDLDGNEYVDLAMGFGVNFFGHAPEFIRDAIRRQLDKGIQVGPQSPLAGRVAELVSQLTGMERVTFTNSGTEAVMTAVRIARAATGRRLVAVFSGSYHGSFDGTLVRVQPFAEKPLPVPLAPGVMPGMVSDLLVLEYGEDSALEELERVSDQLAAVLVEPVQSRRPDLQPGPFLRALRELTARSGVALIFDEVITGFRIHPGGAQAHFQVTADLATYGKVVGGGMPIGVVAGAGRFMDSIDGGLWRFGDGSYPRVDKTFFAGTFCKHPLSMAAAEAVLTRMQAEGPELQAGLNRRTERLAGELEEVFAELGAPLRIVRFGSLFRYQLLSDHEFGDLFYTHLVTRGVYAWEGRTCFVTSAHSDEDLEKVVAASRESATALLEDAFLTPRAAVAAAAPAVTEVPIEVPLTDAQHGLWAVAQLGREANAAYNECLTVRLRGRLDVKALQRALDGIVARHDALRLTVTGDGTRQRIAPAGSLPLSVLELPVNGDQDRAEEEAVRREVVRPFDLSAGPLARVRLLRRAPEEHLLVLVVHHIAVDGRSFGLFLEEVSELYRAARAGESPALPPATAFGQFAQQQQRRGDDAERAAAERFWIDRFTPPPPPLDLPQDAERPAVQTYAGAEETLRFDREVGQRLRQLGPEHGSTLFMVLLAAFLAFLYRLTGQRDQVVGVHSAQQALASGPRLFGLGIQTLPLRRVLDPAETFLDLLAGTKAELLQALRHDQCHIGWLMKTLKLVRDPSRPPLISVVFNLDDGYDSPQLGELEVEARVNPYPFARFDSFWNLIVRRDAIDAHCVYNTDLYTRSTVAGWLAQLHRVTEALAASPHTRLDELDELFAATSRERIASRRGELALLRRAKLGGARRKPVSLG